VSAAVAQVAEAAAVARSVVHVAVVCCVSCMLLLVLSFWDIPFLVTLLAFVLDCNSHTVIIAVAVLLLCGYIIIFILP